MESLSAYAGLLAAGAPYALQLAASTKWWPILFPLFALPALSLCLSVATLSRKGPLNTYASLTPIAAGIGWALAFHVGERLLAEMLRAAQTLLYIVFSVRTSLDWAIDCGHSYNSRECSPFADENVTEVHDYSHWPDNFWPAQEFNRYLIRDNILDNKNLSKLWEPNEWYIGRSYELFYFSIPSIPLIFSHIVIWTIIYCLLVKFPQWIDFFITRFCLFLPSVLYVFVIFGLAISGFSFGNTEAEVSQDEIEKVPQSFWTDLKGFYRSSILLVDYSTAFTGISLLVVSRLNHGAPPVLAWVAVPLMMVIPIFLSVLTTGCEGHITKLQPHYKTYGSIDETYSFDVIPVCLATTRAGPLWSFMFYVAHFFYSCMGPLIIYTLYIYSVFSEQFIVFHTHSQSFYSGFCAL
ncbi:unnamed protein product, partial [Mesorhabditis belari]|uniref:Uncharacterized protein n=1 Tax=Mesorhabditis belari TaxID=2138241 RepID=A0AAF3F864_9BILA